MGAANAAVLALAVAAAALTALATTARAQSFDGTYLGTMTCDSIVGSTRRPLLVPAKIVVAGTTATYEREIRALGNSEPTGQYERGKGTVSTTGAIALSGGGFGNGASVSASYSGIITAGVARLTGTQRWTLVRGAPDAGGPRKCSIEAKAER